MESWKDIVENFNIENTECGITDLDQIPPPKSDSIMGFTISPPKFNYSDVTYLVLLYIYLEPLRFLFDNYNCVVYCEFSKQGRLHFHGYVEFDDTYYSIVYSILNSLEYHYTTALRNRFILKSNTVGKKKVYKISRKAQVKAELSLHSREEWIAYCRKDIEHTRKLLEKYAIIDSNEWHNLKTLFVSKFNIMA